MNKKVTQVKQNWSELVKRGSLILIIPVISVIYTILNKITGNEVQLGTVVDKYIPFCKYFVIPYAIWYPYIATFLILLCVLDKKNYYKALVNLIIGMLISYFIFYIFPTYVPRPKVIGSDIFSKLVLFVYNNDQPCNCFPSVHVLNSMIIALYVNRSSFINKTLKIISSIIAILIIMSTVFIKQHVILDVVGGIALGSILYFLINLFMFNENK